MLSTPVLFFDDTCLLCSKSIEWIVKHEKEQVLSFSTFRSALAQKHQLSSTEPSSMIVLEKGILLTKSAAIIALSKYLKAPFSILYFFRILPSWVLDPIYTLISKNRYQVFGRQEEYCPTDLNITKRIIP
jgi:predicted DCC family thiol-disulfide oxidoreductase YuxK